MSDGESASDSDSEWDVDTETFALASGREKCAFNCDYGDLEETGGSYKVQFEDGEEMTLEEHDEICGCDLDDDYSFRLLSDDFEKEKYMSLSDVEDEISGIDDVSGDDVDCEDDEDDSDDSDEDE